MLKKFNTLFFCCLFNIVFLYSSQVYSDSITVAVAANFAETLEAISAQFEQLTGHQVRLVRGSSGRHYAQIVNGAPFDLFFSADTSRPAALVDAQVVETSAVKPYAIGQLALWSPVLELTDTPVELLHSGEYRHLAIANPRLAPYGRAAEEVLSNIGLSSLLNAENQPTTVLGENVAQAYQFVASGNAELGFVALSQVQGVSPQEQVWLVPQALHSPITQALVILNGSPPVQQLVDFIYSSQVASLLQQHGYLIPTQ